MRINGFTLFGVSFVGLVLLVTLISCGGKKQDTNNMTVLTERIQYPVFIKSPYGDDASWWKENMEGPKREKFVNWIFDVAKEGKVKAYNYDDTPLTPEQVRAICEHTDTVRMQRPDPPYDEIDTVIKVKIDLENIHRITFLEEWNIDEEHFIIQKKVVGICPAETIYGDSSELRGYKPLFWIYLDDKYPIK